MKVKEVSSIAVLAGEILLCSGAEINRVEDTIVRICNSYDKKCECLVIATGIFITISDENDYITVTKRISKRTFDLHRIELINTFSRSIENEKLSYETAIEKLKGIENNPYFNFITQILCAGCMCFVYCLFFDSTIFDALTAFIIGCIVYTTKTKISEIGSFQFLEDFVSGILTGGFAVAAHSVFGSLSIDKIIIGSIMILVPGIAITNGIKDALYGDFISSFSRIGEAILVVTAVGIGVAVALVFNIRWM